jgi:hypothetical protein
VTGTDQAGDVLGVLLVGGALHALVGVVDLHADHVVLEPGSPVEQTALVGDVRAGGAHVAEDDPGRVHPLGLDDVQHVAAAAEPAGQVHLHRQPGLALGGEGSAQAGALGLGEVGTDPDLADDPGAHAVLPVPQVGEDPLGHAVRPHRPHVAGVGVVQVEAGAGDDVDAGALADRAQPRQVPADAEAGGLHHGPAPERRVARQFLAGDVDVVEAAVVAVAEGVLAQLPEQGLPHRRRGELLAVHAGGGGGGPPRRHVVEQVLVGQRDAEVLDGDHAPDRGDRAGRRRRGGAHPRCPEMRRNSRAFSRMATTRIRPCTIGTQ